MHRNGKHRNVLQRALHSLSDWHGHCDASGMVAMEEVLGEVLQTGIGVFSPALALKPSSDSATVAVWVDKPLKSQKTRFQNGHDCGAVDDECPDTVSPYKEWDVPLYDRACISALSCQEFENLDRLVYVEPAEDSRCFNCGSYSHALRRCPRPHSSAAIRNARDTAINKRGSKSRTPSRYYKCSPGGRFDGLKPGVLSLEARKAIGITELDPPPWLHRMREIGYPPGYLEDAEDESSGVQIIDEEIPVGAPEESSEDGNDVQSCIPADEPKAGRKMTVDYPGINAPIPEKTDPKSWVVSPEILSLDSRGFKRPCHHISHLHDTGSDLFSPQSPLVGGVGGADPSREERPIRRRYRDYAESYSRYRFHRVESQIDVYGSNLYCATSPVVNMCGNLSVDPSVHWSNNRVNGASSPASEGTNYHDARSGTQTSHHHIPSSPSGLASPLREMFGTPGAAESFSSTSHIYSRHIHYHSQTQEPPLPHGQSPSQTANPAWLKAQAALDAMAVSRVSGSSPSSPRQAPTCALQNPRDPRVQHQ